MPKLSKLFAICCLFVSSLAQAVSVGDFADYASVRNRTTPGVRSTLKLSIPAQTETGFMLRLDYFVGAVLQSERGYKEGDAPLALFNGEWLQQLRDEKYVETESFKAEHLGYESAAAGRSSYPQCDKIRIYDIKDPEGRFQDAEVIAWLTDNQTIPVLGLVKMDLKGKYQGTPYKIGYDYQAQP